MICAGTSDLPVMEEAQLTAEIMGNDVEAIVDVGVAGLHRLLHHHTRLLESKVIVVAPAWKARCRAWSADWWRAR